MICTSFIFDNITSESMGLSIVKISSGEFANPFLSSQEILEEQIYKVHTPYFFRVKKKPLEFKIICSLSDGGDFTPEKKMQIAHWLVHEEYKEFISEDNPNIIYNVMIINQADFMSYGTFQGYFEIQFRCDAPWGYSATYLENFDLSEITIPTIIEIKNYSNCVKYLYPEIEFTLSGTNAGLTLINLSNAGEQFIFTNLSVGEKIYTSNEHKQIISDLGLYRLGNFNRKWFRLVYGVNRIQVTGKCLLSFRYRFPLLA